MINQFICSTRLSENLRFLTHPLNLFLPFFAFTSCHQSEFLPSLVFSSVGDKTEQINEIYSLIEKYGEGNFAIVELSSLNGKNGKAYTTNAHEVPETIIKEIYTGIAEFDAVTKSSESEYLTVRNRHGLYSGSYQDYRDESVYKFYSIDTSTVVVLDVSGSVVGDETEPSCSLTFEPVVDCEEGDNSECLGECFGDIDILFLWSDLAKEQFASELGRVAHLDLMMDQLRLANSNSNIGNTYNYHYGDYNYEITNQVDCGSDLNTFLDNNPEVYEMRNAFGADIVVFLSNPGERWDFALACVPELGVNPEKAFTVIPIDRSLQEFAFSHEVGHLFGAAHGAGVTAERNCCGRGRNVSFFLNGNVTTFNSIMHGAGNRIPYYTDPDISYEYNGLTEPIGSINQGRMWNNAGLLRNYGCDVAGITTSIDLNVSLFKDYDNCMLNLYSSVDNSQVSPDKFNWYFSDSQYSYSELNHLGQGYNLFVDDPVPDPCVRYFVHLVVENEGYVVHSSFLQVRGGVCLENVWCGGPTG